MTNVSDAELSRLSSLDEGSLAEIFEHKRHDLSVLDALGNELRQRRGEAAADLYIKVALARRAVTRTQPMKEPRRTLSPPETLRGWLDAFLQHRGLTRPDRRPLYRYRMTDAEYEQAKKILRRLAGAGRLADPDSSVGALFVAYCAEWFRRESVSTFLRWDDPAPDLFRSLQAAGKQALTTEGLDYWRRPLRSSAHAREFLLTVALEGGFPVRILTAGARSWLKDYLRAIMRRTIVGRFDSSVEILSAAEAERGRMRKSYQHDDFVALCSELVDSLVRLRRKAEAQSAGGIRNSALLDTIYPDWRSELPIHVPAEDEALVAELLTGLLDEKVTAFTTEGVAVRRYLVKRDGEWHPALQILADGEISPSKLSGVPPTSRARAIATGELGNHLVGEVALFEPPMGEQRCWRVRPYLRLARLLTGFPFGTPVTTTLSSPDCRGYSWTWPRGDALRSDLLVFEPDEASTPNEPVLRFVGSGSVSSSGKILYVLVPKGWTIQPAIAGAVVETDEVPAIGCKLAHLTIGAYFHSGEDDAARFRVEPDSEERERERELQLSALGPTGFAIADDRWELMVAPLRPLIREATKQPRPPGVGELFVRRPGGRWAAHAGPLSGAGLMELSWRDPVANIQIEKRRLALLPANARIVGTMRSAIDGDIRLHGLSGWTVTVRSAACTVVASDPAGLVIRFTGRPIYRLPMTLEPPVGQSIDVIVQMVGREAAIALADGTILAPGRQLDIGALRGAVAVSPRKTVLQLGARGFRAGSIKTIVDGELPLGILRGAIDETLATLPSQDDLVEIAFIGDSRPSIRISRYRHGQLDRDGATVRWLAPSNHSGVLPVVRMILDPRHEHVLSPQEPGSWRLPEQCKGPCLVYLRDGIDVVSRPVPILLPGAPGSPGGYTGALVSAFTMKDYEERHLAVIEALERLGHGEAKADGLAWLLDASTSLNGLPATALDGLKLLPSSAATLIRLLLSARDEGERATLWALQNELPFLWLALPLRAWLSAMEHQCAALAGALEASFGREKAMSEAVAWLRGVCSELTALEPALECVFARAGLPATRKPDVRSLRDLTGGYIRGQHERGGDASNDMGARLALASIKLPPEIEMTSHADFAGLFAPVLLAASAREKLVLDRDQALLARRTLREDPTYASGAWPYLLGFYD